MRPCDYLRAVACPTLLQKSQSAAGRDVRRAACGPARARGSLQRAPPRGMKGALAPEAPRAPHARAAARGGPPKRKRLACKIISPVPPLGSPTRPLAARRALLAHPLPPGTRTAAAASRCLALKSSSSTSSGSALLLSLPLATMAPQAGSKLSQNGFGLHKQRAKEGCVRRSGRRCHCCLAPLMQMKQLLLKQDVKKDLLILNQVI